MRARALMIAMALEASIAGATQFQSFDRAEQVRRSDLVLVGRVLSVRSGWSGAAIHTDAEVGVDEVWKGAPQSDRVTVRTPGGTVDDVELVVEGIARFREGEEVLLFLTEDGGVYRPWGMTYGKYSIEGGSFVVGNLPPSVAGAQSFELVSVGLEELRREVRGILEGDAR